MNAEKKREVEKRFDIAFVDDTNKVRFAIGSAPVCVKDFLISEIEQVEKEWATS